MRNGNSTITDYRPLRTTVQNTMAPSIDPHDLAALLARIPPAEARRYGMPRPSILAPPDYRLSNFQKAPRQSTRPIVTKLS